MKLPASVLVFLLAMLIAAQASLIRVTVAGGAVSLAKLGTTSDKTEIAVKAIDSKTVSLQHHADWELDSTADDYDPETRFTINSPYNSYVTIRIGKFERNPETLIEDILYRLDGPAITTFSRSNFSQWGKHQGVGRHLKGKIMDMFPGGVRVFVTRPLNNTLIITEFYFSEELEDTAPGYMVISETLVMKE
jgi:hypothetical protein